MRPDRAEKAAGLRAETPLDAAQTVVTFGLGSGLFALPVAPVLEILDMRPVAPLPRAPGHLLGLIDRRGVSVPVVDMRLMLGQPAAGDSPDTRIIVLRLGPAEAPLGVVGLRVDRVIEVTVLDALGDDHLVEARYLHWNERMVAAIGRRGGQFVTLLDIDQLFDLEVIGHATALEGAA